MYPPSGRFDAGRAFFLFSSFLLSLSLFSASLELMSPPVSLLVD